MGEGILKGLLDDNVSTPENITIIDTDLKRCDYLSTNYGVNALTDSNDAIKEASMVIIAVNPPIVPIIAKMIKPLINDNTIVMSTAAGVTMESIESYMGSDKKLVRVMPNTLIQSKNGYSAVCKNNNIHSDDEKFITKIVNTLGQTMYLEEDMFDSFTAFSCAGPLWLYKTVETLTNAGVYIGFSRTDALNIVIKNMIGVGQVLDSTGDHPAIKVDQMTSPAGVTIEGLKVLEEKGFDAAIMASIIAADKKSRSIK